ncbi:hypothetical protein D3C77_395470 [compost metagenome]
MSVHLPASRWIYNVRVLTSSARGRSLTSSSHKINSLTSKREMRLLTNAGVNSLMRTFVASACSMLLISFKKTTNKHTDRLK